MSCSKIQEVNPVLRKLSVLSRAPHKALTSRLSDSGADKKNLSYLDFDDDFYDDEDETLSEEPDAAALQRRRRRRALVPPKLITDGYESCTEFDDRSRHGSKSKSPVRGTISTDPSENNLVSAAERDSEQSGGGKQEDSKSATSELAGEVNSAGASDRSSEEVHKHLMPNVTIESIGVEDSSESMSKEPGPVKASKVKPGSPKSGRPRALPSTSGSSGSSSNHLGVSQPNSRSRRRSSVVVIPPMQICPGDLLVYSKVLSQRSNMIGKCGCAVPPVPVLLDLDPNVQTTLKDHSRRPCSRNKVSQLNMYERHLTFCSTRLMQNILASTRTPGLFCGW